MPAVLPFVPLIAAGLAAAGTTAGLIEQNQATQHAKGAAQAEQTAMQGQIDQANKQNQDTNAQKGETGSATQAAALAALRASMSASSSSGGTILTSGQGTTPAPLATKQLLGA